MTPPETQNPRPDPVSQTFEFEPPAGNIGTSSPDFSEYIAPHKTPGEAASPGDEKDKPEKEKGEEKVSSPEKPIEDVDVDTFDFSRLLKELESGSSPELDKKLVLKPKQETTVEKQSGEKTEPKKNTEDDLLLIDNLFPVDQSNNLSDSSNREVRTENGNWKKDENGAWNFDDGYGHNNPSIKGLAESDKVSNIESLADESLKITLEDESVLRARADGSTLKFKDDKAFKEGHPEQIFKTDDSSVYLNWKEGRLEGAVGSKGDKYEYKDEGTYLKNGKELKGEFGLNSSTGEFITVDSTSGEKTIESTDGSILKEFKDGSSELSLKSPQDNVKRTFKFDKGRFSEENSELSQPKEMVVENPDGTKYDWTRNEDGTYKRGDLNHSAQISVTRNDAGEYSYNFQNLNTGYMKTVTGDSVKELATGSDEIITKKGDKTINMQFDQAQYELGYNPQTSEHGRLEDIGRNTLWKKGSDGNWKAEAIDSSKSFSEPAKFDYQIMNNRELSAEQKARTLENARLVREDPDFDEKEKEKVFENVSKLLDKREGTKFSAKERADLAEQTLWHISHEKRNMQGFNQTCNITDVRGLFINEEPSVVARVMADVANTGRLLTNDGSVIKPDLASLKPREGTPENTFPPADGNRTFLGKVWDVTGINVYYQRQVADISGSTIPKGSMEYREIKPEKEGDHGHRLVKTDNQGKLWTLNKNYADGSQWGRAEPLDQPYFHGFNMMDVYSQLSSNPKQGKMIVDKNEYVGTKEQAEKFESLGGVRVETADELENFLSKADFPVIVQLNTAILKQRSMQRQALKEGKDPSTVKLGTGGEHVVLLMSYEKGNPENGNVSTLGIDNSWYAKDDFDTPGQAKNQGLDSSKQVFITVDDIYQSMKTQSSGGKPYTWTWVHRGS